MKNLTEEQYSEILNAKHPKRVLKSFFQVGKLEVGKWYKYHNAILNYQGIKNSLIQSYGLISGDCWMELANSGCDPEKWILATDQEVETALIAEAKNRGYKVGLKFLPLFNSGISYETSRTIHNNEFIFDRVENSLDANNQAYRIFVNGKWAEKL